MVDEVIDGSTAPDGLRVKRDELLKSIKPAEAPKLTEPDVYEGLIKKESEATLGAAKKKAELEVARADRESRTARDLSQKYESQYKDIPEFKATPESKAELVGLFGLIGAIGAFGGGKSYGSALGAMNAMGGMLKGYREGRKDLFEREKAEFDKNMQSIKAHNDQITAAFNRAKELAKTNLSAAERKLFTDLKSLEADALATNLYKKGLMETDKMRIEVMNRANTQTEQALKTVASIDKTLGTGSKGAPIKVKAADGKTYYADREGNPILDPQGKPLQAPETRTGAAEVRYSFNVAESMGQAIRDLENVQALPRDSVLGNFAGLTGEDAKGMIDGLKKAFARNITDEDNRVFEQVIGGLEANLARALGGGYASSTTAKNIQAYRAQVAREGDTPMAKAIFLARIRQELDTLADFFEARPGAETFVPVVKKYQKTMQEAVPFTVKDVIKARNELETLPIGTERTPKAPAAPAPAPKAAKPTLDQFLEKAKPRNPNMSDQQLIDYYNQTYGAQ
jgi:hypothetical protein